MAPVWSVIANRKDKANQKVWTEYRANIVSGCPGNPGDIVMLGASGKIDPCLLPSTTGLVIEIDGVVSPCQDVLNFIPGTGITITYSPDCGYIFTATGTATCGSAAFLCTDVLGTEVEVDLSHPTHPGQLLISQPGNTTAIWADPQVQGLYAAGSTICPAPVYVAPTCIQPVLVGAEDPSGKLQNLKVDPLGNLLVNPNIPLSPSGGSISSVVNMKDQALTGAVDGYERFRVSTPVTLFDANYDFVTPGPVPSNFVITSVANASGGFTTYTGVFPGGDMNGVAGYAFEVTGFLNPANNGTFGVASSTATTVTLLNPAGVAEVAVASAASPTTEPLQFTHLIVGSGTLTILSTEPSLQSAVGTETGARAVWQSKEYLFGQEDKAQIFTCWGVIGTNVLNVIQRLGSFDDESGYFFEQNGVTGTLRVVKRSNFIDIAVPQSSWNIDKLDGTGPSGVTLDPMKGQVWTIDIGAFHIRFGVFIAGVLTYAHQLNEANFNPDFPRAVAPVRVEIVNVGPSVGNFMKHANMSISVEGGFENRPSPYAFAVTTPGLKTGITTLVPILSVRPKLLFAGRSNRTTLTLRDYSIFSVGQLTRYVLIYNGILVGANFQDVNPLFSAMEFDSDATAIYGGNVVQAGFLAAFKQDVQFGADNFVFRLPLTLDLLGTVADTYTIAVEGVNGTATTVGGAFKWQGIH